MNEVLAIGLQAMQGDMARLEQVGMNLANALTPGYKAGLSVQGASGASFASHFGAAASALDAASLASAVTPHTVTPHTVTTQYLSDTRPATLKLTGEALDVALAGPGYFEVMTGQGPAYTRSGSFRVDGQGRLVTTQGHAVMGAGGEIVLKSPSPTIDASGAITSSPSADAQVLGRLRVVQFEAGAQLTPLGDNLLAAGPAISSLQGDAVQVRQGFVENSNVNPAREMTNLIQTMRHFESMQKVVQTYDDMLGNAIRKLGEN
ncbi:flagellar hook-basal body protein [Caenimonas sp. SL110]|uniref:flagellar hook-basal body protein n=1 Tax=Caenimonas sp. SL110 TaxID=1450524 RepID=UPI00065378B8|nr:flagellar hook-basal body protein [Caenimonas sp. SL110]